MTPSAALVPSHLRCADCRGVLVGSAGDPASLLRCVDCGGAWIAPAKLLSLGRGEISSEDRALLAGRWRETGRRPRTPFRDACELSGGERPVCPECEAPLRRAPVPDAGVVVGVCGGHGVAVRAADVGRVTTTIEIQAALREVAPPRLGPTSRRSPLPGRWLLVAGGIVFGASLALPSVEISIFSKTVLPGLVCLVLSPLTVVEQPLALPCVLGNLLVLSLPLVSRRLTGAFGAIAALVAAGAATSAWLLGVFVMGDDALVGFWVWFAAFVLLAVGLGARSAARRPA